MQRLARAKLRQPPRPGLLLATHATWTITRDQDSESVLGLNGVAPALGLDHDGNLPAHGSAVQHVPRQPAATPICRSSWALACRARHSPSSAWWRRSAACSCSWPLEICPPCVPPCARESPANHAAQRALYQLARVRNDGSATRTGQLCRFPLGDGRLAAVFADLGGVGPTLHFGWLGRLSGSAADPAAMRWRLEELGSSSSREDRPLGLKSTDRCTRELQSLPGCG
jgi:hypothetical protein